MEGNIPVLENQTSDDGACRKQSVLDKVFFNKVILGHLFEYLEFETLLEARLVCLTWKETSEPTFRKKARISFHFPDDGLFDKAKYGCPENTYWKDNCPKRLLESVIFKSPSTEFAINEFKLGGCIPWSILELIEFFENKGEYIKTFICLNVTFANQNPLENYDITPLIPQNVQTLCFAFENKFPVISLKRLASIPDIIIHGTSLILKGEKIVPKKLDLRNVMFIKDGWLQRHIKINDFVDFRKMEFLSLHNEDKQNLGVNLEGSDTINDVRLHNIVKIRNWEQSKWNVNKLLLNCGVIETISNIQIKDLSIREGAIDLAFLPKAVEKLSVFQDTRIYYSFPVSLPNLRYLSLQDQAVPFFHHFSNFPSLVDVHLVTWPNADLKLNVNLIPRSVRRLQMENGTITMGNGDHAFELDTLIYGSVVSTFQDLEQVLAALKPNFLRVKLKEITSSNEDTLRVQELLKSFSNILLGMFKWNDDGNDFSTSPIAQCVDRKAKYYLFKNGIGKGLGFKEMEKLTTL